MNRLKIASSAAAMILVVGGAATYHWYQNHAVVVRDLKAKEAGVVQVSLVPVTARAFRETLPFTGTLLAVNRAELKAEVPGRVTRVTVQEGDRVASGALLGAQDEDELLLAVQGAQGQLDMAQAQAQQASRDNDRAVHLLARRSITRQTAQQAETACNAAHAAVQSAEANLGLARSRLHKSRITSPFAGEVAQRLVQPGEMLAPGQTAFVVVDNRRLEIQANLPAGVLSRVRVGMKATFRVNGFTEPFTATLTQVSPSVQADGRTLRVRLEVPNPDGRLKGGLFAEGQILDGTGAPRPALPSAVITATDKDADLFVVEGGVARLRKVMVGAEQEGWRPVDGLALGATVVDQGRDHVLDGSRVQAAAAGGK
jgi:RND family efflux transporter MFP subunit